MAAPLQFEEKPQIIRSGGGILRFAIALAILAVILSLLPGKAAIGFGILVVLGAILANPDVLG